MSERRADAKLRLALLPGDGIGVEVVAVAERVLRELLGGRLETITLDAGWGAFERTGAALPPATLDAVRACDGALLGAVASPSRRVEGYRSPVVALRRELDLFANLRPAVSAPVPGARPGIDLLIVRENTEGLYGAPERHVVLDDGGEAVITERRISRRATERIARAAFLAARSRAERLGRPSKVTVVHKANVLRTSDGLFRETALEVASEHPDVAVDEALVDACAYHLVRTPERFDVLVAPNLYGDVLSDLAAGLVGGLGLVPSVNRSDAFVLAEPVHGSAPDIEGQGIANPIATLRAAALLLENLGESEVASNLNHAVEATLAGNVRTPDIGGTSTTAEVEEHVKERLSRTVAS